MSDGATETPATGRDGSAPFGPAMCSASERSADEWAAAARKAMNLAMDATEQGNAGTASEHRKTAQLCFECERSLRQMQNIVLGGKP